MKARPTNILKLDKLDNYGNTTFIIEFDEGTKGFYTSKSPDQTKFVIGNVVDFEVEVKQGSKGPYNKITIPNTGFKPGGGKPQDPKLSFTTMSYSYAKDLVVAGKMDMHGFHGLAKDIFDNMVKNYNK